MKYSIQILFFSLILILANGGEVCAQVWPGDANNDGRVSNVDLVYLGYAFGQFGPARDSVSNDWSEQRLPIYWQKNFPNTSVNMGFADCDGDGLVSILDVLAISGNYREINPVAAPETFVSGFNNIDPAFSFVDSSGTLHTPHLEGVTLSARVGLGSFDLPIESLNGIAFTIRFDPDVIEPGSVNLFMGSSWLNPSGNQLLQFQNSPEPGVLEVGVSNFGQQASSGFGNIGILYFVIQDDIISFRPNEDSLISPIMIENIVVVDTGFNEIPIAGDSLSIKVVKPSYFLTSIDILPESYLQLFPNPVSNRFVMRTGDLDMETIEIHDAFGRLTLSRDLAETRSVELSVANWPNGMYLVRVHTDQGLIVKRLIVNH